MERDARLQSLLLKHPVDELNMVKPSKVLCLMIWNSKCNSKSEYAVSKLVVFDLVDGVPLIAPQDKESIGVKSGVWQARQLAHFFRSIRQASGE